MIQHLEFRVTSLLNEIAKLKSEALEYARNQVNPFESRWEAFQQFARLGGKKHSWVYHGWDDLPLFPKENWKDEVVNELNWYEDFNAERYQTYDLLETGLDRLLDKIWYEQGDDESEISKAYEQYQASGGALHPLEWALTVHKHPIMIQAVEALIRDGVTSFCYDW